MDANAAVQTEKAEGEPVTSETESKHLPYPDQARTIVLDYFNQSRDATDKGRKDLLLEDVYVVWFCKTLQNWKALVSTTVPDLVYYEVTYNGNENLVYLDIYSKTLNMEIPLPPPYRTPYD
jgi:hypothetical protein